MPEQRPETGPNSQRPPAGARSPGDVLQAARDAAAGRYDILGALGPGAGGEAVFLARRLDNAQLLAVRFRVTALGAASFDEMPALDRSVPSPAITCPKCHHPVADWQRHCSACGTDVTGADAGATPDAAPATVVATVAQLASEPAAGKYEVLGAMPRASGGAPVYFGRDHTSGRLVTMSLEAGAGGEGPGEARHGVTVIEIAAEPAAVLPTAVHPTSPPRPPQDPSLRIATPTSWEPPRTPSGRTHTPDAHPPMPPAGSVRVCPQCGAEYALSDRFCPTDGSTLILRSPATDLVGQILARRYEIRRMLGEGGMGQVYLAEQIKMRRLCALKVMHTEQMHDADAAGRFGREAYNASRIMHPNVAAIYDFGETEDGRLYIAMEYVDGAPLSDLLRREQRLPIDRSIDIGIQVAEALAAAHELNIVHRDLKPDNVMLATGKGGRDVVKVVDFGIAKAVQTDGQQITRTGFIVGTPAYMSPEQISGDPLDGRSDIYALGCILFKMLTGTEPLGGPGQAVLMRRLTEPPPRPRSLNPSIPPALDDVVVRALARMAQDRFDSAEAFAQALRAASTAPREVSRGGAIWSALRARFLSWARPRPIAVVGPPPLAEPADAIVATPHSPALARPRVQWAGGAVTPQPGPSQSQTPAGTVAAAGAPAVAVAGAQPSPPVPWRIHVDPAAITPGPVDAAFPTTPQDQRRPTRGLAIPVTVAATGIVIAIALAVRHPDSPTKNARVQEPMAVPPPSASVTERDRPQGPSAIPGAVGDTVGGPRQTNVSRGSNAIAPTVTLRDFQAAELAALHTRDLAAQVGATPRELAHGDSLRLRAEGLAESGQYAGASGLATRADQAWAGAHRVAEERIKAVAPTTVTPTLGGETPKSTPPAGTTASRSSDTAAAPDARPPRPAGAPFTASTDTTTVAAAGAGDVRKVVTAYIAAVNTRQMAEMRRIWPTMPDDAAHNWQALFNAATDLSVKLVSADDPAVNGSHAQTDFAYSITGYVPSQGAIPSSTLHFRAKLERDAWGWRIVSMDRRK